MAIHPHTDEAFGDLCAAIAETPARYVAFDLLWLNGVDLRERSLVLRR